MKHNQNIVMPEMRRNKESRQADLAAAIICIISLAIMLAIFIPAVDKEQSYTEQKLDSQLSKEDRMRVMEAHK